jgi:hypothetical protein
MTAIQTTTTENTSHQFTCCRCGYSTPKKALLIKHLHRRVECPPIFSEEPVASLLEAIENPVITLLSYPACQKCCDCGKILKNANSLRYHKSKHCNKSAANLVRENHQSSVGRSIVTNNNTNTINNNINNNNNILQNVTNNITINAFGKENIDHISTQFLDQCVRRTDKGLVELIEKIHFDPDHNENCNMKVTNLKMPIMQVHNGLCWKYDKKTRVLSDLVDKGHGMMQEHFDDHEDRIKDQVSETMFDHIRKWMDKMQDRDKKVIESVLTDMYLLILNAGGAD